MQAISKNSYKYLKFINFNKLAFWDYNSLIAEDKFTSDFKIVKLKSVITQRKGFIDIGDEVCYRLCRVKLHGKGVVLRDQLFGRSIKTKKQQICKANDFLVAEIDAKFGGYGIVPLSLDGAIVSGHYFLFEINTKNLLPEYLGLILKTKPFSQQVKATGSTNYAAIRPFHVLEYNIPLPSIKEQQAIINQYWANESIAEKNISEITDLNNKIEDIFKDELKLKFIINVRIKNKLQFLNYSTIGRWDVWNNVQYVESERYEFKPLSTLILDKPQYGANAKTIQKQSNTRYIRITDINEDGTLNDEFVSASEVDEQFILENNDFLIARSGNTVGKTLLYTSEMGRAMFAGYLIRFKLNSEVIHPKYLLYYTKSKAFKVWILNNQRVSGQPNINGQEYLMAPIVVPEFSKQKKIVEQIELIRLKVFDLKKESEKLREKASSHLEEILYSKN